MAEAREVLRRRQLLKRCCALGLSLPAVAHAQFGSDPAASAPPEIDDRLVFAFGEREGQIMRPEHLAVGAEQTFAWAKQAGSGIVRNGTRLYQLLVLKLDPEWLSEATRARSVDGVVAYSGVCTHTGCDITLFDAEQHHFQCPCHESQFDPKDGARVIGGPAPWPLAALPLKTIDGELAVAGTFEGRVGFQQPGLSPFGI